MEMIVLFDKAVFNGKTDVLNSTFKALNDVQIIAAKKTLIEATKKPKVPTAENVVNTREFVADVTKDLLSLSKVEKVVRRDLQAKNAENFNHFLSLLSEKQRPNFNEMQYNQLVKSPKLVTKIFTDSQRIDFVNSGLKCTPNTYLNAIKKGACMSAANFKKKQSLTV